MLSGLFYFLHVGMNRLILLRIIIGTLSVLYLDALVSVLYSVQSLDFLAEGFHRVSCASSQIL
jgi:hypothetical protein